MTPASLAAPAPLTVFGQPFLLGGPFGHQSAGLLQEGRGRAAEPLPLEALPLTPARSQLWLLSVPQRHGLALTIWYTSPNWGVGGARPLLESTPVEMESLQKVQVF